LNKQEQSMNNDSGLGGGPAFGTRTIQSTHMPNGGRDERDLITTTETKGGMTLRDYIAIAAMNGSLGGAPGSHLVPHTLARESYEMADAMLKARAS